VGGGAIKAIVFDWGRTLYDSENGALFPETAPTLAALSRRYRLAIVSLVTRGDYHARVEERYTILRQRGIEHCFAAILFARADKDRLYVVALARLGLEPKETAIVDDRMARGIRWGNRHGATTIWLRRGRIAGELPDDDTGAPTHTIGGLSELGALPL